MTIEDIFPRIEWLERWKTERNSFAYKTCLVFNKSTFPLVCKQLSDCNDLAYISIECSNDLVAAHRIQDNNHYLEPSDHVLNIDFDDVEEDRPNCHAITEEQGKILYDFIKQQVEDRRHFIIHCNAGRSRSQGVARAIYDIFNEQYKPNGYNNFNPCQTPNQAVVAAIKKPAWKENFRSCD